MSKRSFTTPASQPALNFPQLLVEKPDETGTPPPVDPDL